MATPLIIRIGATMEFGMTLAGSTGWFPDYLPIAGSHAVEAAVVIGAAVLLNELVELTCEIVGRLRAWWRGAKLPPSGMR